MRRFGHNFVDDDVVFPTWHLVNYLNVEAQPERARRRVLRMLCHTAQKRVVESAATT